MQQLGFSLDAVALMDVFEDDTNVHLVSVETFMSAFHMT